MQARIAETAYTHTADSGLDCNSLVFYPGVCDRALKNAQQLKIVTVFCCLSNFATTSFLQKDALQINHLKPRLLILSTANSIKKNQGLGAPGQNTKAGRLKLSLLNRMFLGLF
jgi:hypothetical protein